MKIIVNTTDCGSYYKSFYKEVDVLSELVETGETTALNFFIWSAANVPIGNKIQFYNKGLLDFESKEYDHLYSNWEIVNRDVDENGDINVLVKYLGHDTVYVNRQMQIQAKK